MPAIFYLPLPPIGETPAVVGRLSRPDTSHAAEPHLFDELVDRVTAPAAAQPVGASGSERRYA